MVWIHRRYCSGWEGMFSLFMVSWLMKLTADPESISAARTGTSSEWCIFMCRVSDWWDSERNGLIIKKRGMCSSSPLGLSWLRRRHCPTKWSSWPQQKYHHSLWTFFHLSSLSLAWPSWMGSDGLLNPSEFLFPVLGIQWWSRRTRHMAKSIRVQNQFVISTGHLSEDLGAQALMKGCFRCLQQDWGTAAYSATLLGAWNMASSCSLISFPSGEWSKTHWKN